MINYTENDSLLVSSARAGTVVYPPGGHYGPREQIRYQLVLLHSGKMDISIDGKIYHVPAGNVCLLRPGTREEFFFAQDKKTWHRWIDVDVRTIPTKMKLNLKLLPFYLPISDAMNQLTDLMLFIQQSETTPVSRPLPHLGAAALNLFIDETNKLESVNLLCHPAVQEAKSIIHKRFSDDISINDLANEICISTDHLVRLFKKQVGVTPTDYLWKRRIYKGIDLLRYTGLTVNEIAYQSGFKTSQHFSRSIKRHFNLTPTEVRENSLKGQEP